MTGTNHTLCNKETEIAEMHLDIKYIRKALEGNGKKGLIDDIRDNSQYRHECKGKASLTKFMVGGGWLTTIVVLLLSQIK